MSEGLKPWVMLCVPRTASTSLSIMLGVRPPILSGGVKPKLDPDGRYFGHATASWIMNMYGYDAWRRTFSFGFVRNPWDRVLSICARINQEALKTPETLTAWLKAGCPDSWKGVPHQVAQDTFIHQSCSEFLLPCTYIGRFETLTVDVERICRIIDVPITSWIHEEKSARDRPLKDYYSEEGCALVRALYKDDFINFGYPTQP